MKSISLFGSTPALLSLFIATLISFPTSSSAQLLDNGLKIETTRPASCMRKSKKGDTIHVHYRGTLQKDGQEFDSSYGRGEPFVFTVGNGQVIKGWDLGLLDMCIGEARNLTIPPGLAYGDRNMGKIPPNSVLIFQTELMGIDGVEKESSPPPPPAEGQQDTPQDDNSKAQGSKDGPKKGEEHHGECKLLGRFAILIQSALGGLALLSLVWKRWREKPRRPVRIWFFDVSKQVVGSILIHFANLFLSMLSSGGFELSNSATSIDPLQDGGRKHPNPCSFYLLNLAIDTTVGIPILVFFLRLFHAILVRTPLANPPESLKSGNYGQPPNWRWWIKQTIVYFLGLFSMKLCVFLLFLIFPWLGWVGDWALKWTEGKEWVQITFVMLIFPLIMNIIQYWIIDSFIKDPAAEYDYAPVEGARDNDESDGEENEGLMGRSRVSEEGDQPVRRISPAGGRLVADVHARTKEANPLPLPVEFESEDEDDLGNRH